MSMDSAEPGDSDGGPPLVWALAIAEYASESLYGRTGGVALTVYHINASALYLLARNARVTINANPALRRLF